MTAALAPNPLGHEALIQDDIGTPQGDTFAGKGDSVTSQGDTWSAQGDRFSNKATFLALDTVTSVTSPTSTVRNGTIHG